MSLIAQFRRLHKVYFSKPKSSRILYRAVSDLRARSIVELGITDPERSLQLLKMACGLQKEPLQVVYTAIDLFDARPDTQESLSLKQAHRHFSAAGAKIQLVPGSPGEGFARTANSLLQTDLVIISLPADVDADPRLWVYLPRVLHAGSRVLQVDCTPTEDQELTFREIVPAEIERLAAQCARRQVA